MPSEMRSQEITRLRHAAWLEQAPERMRSRKESFSRRQSGDPVRVFVIDADLGIALTSDIRAVDRFRALEAGFERYLTIPVQNATLQSVLRPSLQHGSHLRRSGISRRRH